MFNFTALSRRLLSLTLACAMLLCTLPELSLPARAETGAVFSDISGHWAESIIEIWADYGIVKGNNGKFRPNDNMTRAEFSAVINRLFRAETKASISFFLDVSKDKWYYDDIALAVQMGVINGTSVVSMSPDAKITRQDAMLMIARAIGLTTENTAGLSKYSDEAQLAGYARRAVAALSDAGYVKGSGGKLNPKAYIKRAEVMSILDALVSVILPTEYNPYNFSAIQGNLLVNTPDRRLSGVQIQGDLILGDGVGKTDFTMENCSVSGRLIIRGGGSNSIHISNSTVSGGVFVSNRNNISHVLLSDGASVGVVTARNSLVLEGYGAASLIVPSDAEAPLDYTVKYAELDAIDIAAPETSLDIVSSGIDNLRFLQNASDGLATTDSYSKINHLLVNAPYVTVNGGGSVRFAQVNKVGARVSPTTTNYFVADSMTAYINGANRSGRYPISEQISFDREASDMLVSRDSNATGGSVIVCASRNGAMTNTVTVTQLTGNLELTEAGGRLAYWLGFFIPAPSDYASQTALVRYNFDGQPAEIKNLSRVYKDNKLGFLIYIPVKRNGSELKGSLNQTLHIDWSYGSRASSETIFFSGSNISLAAPSAENEAALVAYFRNAVFKSYSGYVYSGSEAILRLLTTDNPLGLSVASFTIFSDEDRAVIVNRLNTIRSSFTSRAELEKLFVRVEQQDKGILYSINRAANAEQIKALLDNSSSLQQLSLEDSYIEKYSALSQVGRTTIAKAVLSGRGTDFPDEAAIAAIVTAQIDIIRPAETALLTAINACKTRDEMQAVIETAANAAALGIVVTSPPYSSLSAEAKTNVAGILFMARPFSSLDAVRAAFIEQVGEPSNQTPEPSAPIDPKDNPNIVSVSAEQTAYTVAIGSEFTIEPVINTSTGSFTSASDVTIVVDKTNIATVSADGSAVARALGSAKVTMTSVKNTKIKGTVTITVVARVPSTGISLPYTYAEVGMGDSLKILSSIFPSNSTDIVKWTSSDTSIATVNQTGKVVGVSPGFVTINVRADSGVMAYCTLAVCDTKPAIMMDRANVTVGIGSWKQVLACVSPVTAGDRSIRWTISDPNVATVSASGRVTGLRAGTATLTATSSAFPDKSVTCTVLVDPDLKGLYLDRNSITMYKNGVDALSASVAPASETTEKLDWFVEKGGEKIVSVDTAGNIKALESGVATITVSLASDATVKDSCQIEVLSTKLGVTINKKTTKLNVGDQDTLSFTFTPSDVYNQRIAYTSSNDKVATIDEAGIITALAKGTTRITCIPQADTSIVLTCDVTVTEVALNSVSLNTTSTVLLKNQNYTINPILTPVNASVVSVSYTSDNESLVKVTGGGILREGGTLAGTLMGYGSTLDENGVDKPVNITVTVSTPTSTKSATMKVSVSDENAAGRVTSVDILMDSWVVQAGTSDKYITVVFNGDYSGTGENQPPNRNVTFTSSDPNVAFVDTNRRIVAKNPGRASITVTSEDGSKTASKHIIVAPIGISTINYSSLDNPLYGNWIGLDLSSANKKRNPGAAAPDSATDKRLTFQSADERIATVDENGNVTAVSPGLTSISVMPQTTSRYGITTPTDKGVDLLASGITRIGDDYYDPNNCDPDTMILKVGAEKLDPTKPIPLLLKNTITDGSDRFLVWVRPTAPVPVESGAVTLSGSSFLSGDSFSVKISLMPSYATVDKVEITAGDAEVSSFSVENGILTVQLKALPVISAASATLALKLSMYEAIGPSPKSDGVPLKTNAASITVTTQQITVSPRPATALKIVADGSTTGYFGAPALKLQAVFTPDTTTNKNVTWESSNVNIAKVSADGTVSFGSTTGTATITARAAAPENNTVSATISVSSDNGLPLPVSISLPDSFTAFIGTPVAIAAVLDPENARYGIAWSSSNPDVATVEGSTTNAVISPLSPGTATITAVCAADSSISATLTVTVKNQPATSISVVEPNPSENGYYSGAVTALTALFNPANTTDKRVKWLSLNSSIAAVDEDSGVVTFSDQSGAVEIRAVAQAPENVDASGNQLYGSITLTGKGIPIVPPEQILIHSFERTDNLPAFTLYIDERNTFRLLAEALPANASQSVSWQSANVSVLSIDQSGMLTPVSAGTSTVTAISKMDANVRISCVVTVIARPMNSFKIVNSSGSSNFYTNDKLALSISADPANATNKEVIWSSSDPDIADVSLTGLVSFKAKDGEVVITATGKAAENALVSDSITLQNNGARAVAPTKISVDPPLVYIGSDVQITAALTPVNSDKNLIWTVENPAIAAIIGASTTVTLHPIAVGTTSVTVAAYLNPDVKTSFNITVFPVAATSISVSPTALGPFYIGDSVGFSAEVLPGNASNKSVVWSVSPASVADISADGIVTFKAKGTAIVKATGVDENKNVSGSFSVTCDGAKPAKPVIAISGNSILYIGTDLRLSATGVPVGDSVVWSSSNTAVAAVTKDGTTNDALVSAEYAATPDATVTITARLSSDNTILATKTITLAAAVIATMNQTLPFSDFAVYTSAAEVNMAEAEVVSENPAVASVEENGILTHRAGRAKIFFYDRQGKYIDVTVVVNAPPTALQIRSSANVAAGQTLLLVPYVKPYGADTSELVWSSGNSTVATVDQNGLVTGLKPGNVTIKCASRDGKLLQSCSLTVYGNVLVPLQSISLSRQSFTLEKGKSYLITVTYNPASPSVKGVTWLSSDDLVAAVEPGGRVIGVSKGSVTITAVSDEGNCVAVCYVTVE